MNYLFKFSITVVVPAAVKILKTVAAETLRIFVVAGCKEVIKKYG